MSEEYAIQARRQIDVDEPSMTGLQSLLLLHIAFSASGNGKKAYTFLSKIILVILVTAADRTVQTWPSVWP